MLKVKYSCKFGQCAWISISIHKINQSIITDVVLACKQTQIQEIFVLDVDPPLLFSLALPYSLKGFGSCADMQRHESIFGDSVGIGAVDQQQFGAFWLAVVA